MPKRNPWAPWSLGAGLVALTLECVALDVRISAVSAATRTFNQTGEFPPEGSGVIGPMWLQGDLIYSWWDRAALLLIAIAIAAGVRSLALIDRGADRGLGITASGFVLCSLTLMVGQAVLASVLGVAASVVIYGIYARDRRRAGAFAADSAFAPETYSAANPPWTPGRGRMPARAMAIRAFVLALIGPTVSLGMFAPPRALWLPAMAGALIAVPLSVVALVLGIVALRRTFATGEPGRGWAIFAIVACLMWFVEVGWFLVYMYLDLERNFT